MSTGLNAALSFWLPLSDAGAGAVSLTPASSAGSATPTFTRATSATCWSSAGLLLTVGTGVARSTYTELTGTTYLGYLSEEARTNTCIQNRDFTNAAWVATTMTTAKDQVGIDGAANAASSLLATGVNSTVKQTVTIAAVNRPFSVYVKRLTGTGNIDLAQDGASFTTQSVANDGLWHRVTLVASQLNPILSIRLATNGDKIAVDYAMLEDSAGAARTFPLSPIATTTVAVTRNGDLLTYPTSGNVDQTVGVGYAEVTSGAATGSQVTILGGGPGIIAQIAPSAGDKVNLYDGTTPNYFNTAALPLSTVQKVATRWSGAVSDGFLNGVKGAPGTFDGNMSLGAALGIGATASNTLQLNGTAKNAKIWTVALADAQVAAL